MTGQGPNMITYFPLVGQGVNMWSNSGQWPRDFWKDFLPDKTDLREEKAVLLSSLSFLLATLSGENGIVGEMWLDVLRDMADTYVTVMVIKRKESKNLWSVTGVLVNLLNQIWNCLPSDFLLHTSLLNVFVTYVTVSWYFITFPWTYLN